MWWELDRWRDFTWSDSARARDEVHLYVPWHLMPNRDVGGVRLGGRSQFPLWDMHHAVERVFVVDRLREQLRTAPGFGEEEYAFWRPKIEEFFSNDRVGSLLGDAHRVDPSWHQKPKVMLRYGDRFLNVGFKAEAVSVQAVGTEAEGGKDGVKFDRLRQALNKALRGRETRVSGRFGLGGLLRILGGLANVATRWGWTWGQGTQFGRFQWNPGWRAMRAQDASRVVRLDSRFEIRADWGRDGGTQSSFTSSPIDGWSHVRVRSKELPAAVRDGLDGPVWAAAEVLESVLPAQAEQERGVGVLLDGLWPVVWDKEAWRRVVDRLAEAERAFETWKSVEQRVEQAWRRFEQAGLSVSGGVGRAPAGVREVAQRAAAVEVLASVGDELRASMANRGMCRRRPRSWHRLMRRLRRWRRWCWRIRRGIGRLNSGG